VLRHETDDRVRIKERLLVDDEHRAARGDEQARQQDGSDPLPATPRIRARACRAQTDSRISTVCYHPDFSMSLEDRPQRVAGSTESSPIVIGLTAWALHRAGRARQPGGLSGLLERRPRSRSA
jgi:hypothetical protein